MTTSSTGRFAIVRLGGLLQLTTTDGEDNSLVVTPHELAELAELLARHIADPRP